MLSEKIRAIANGLFVDDEHVSEYASRHNANLAVYVGAGVALLELVMIVSAFLLNVGHDSFKFSWGKIAAYVALGIASAVLSILARKRLADTSYSRMFTNYLIGYLWLAALYGVNNSLIDFANGKQIITFYLAMMMIACVFVTPPIGLFTLVAVTYASAFLLGFSGGRMDTGSLVNFWVSGVALMATGLIRFQECRIASAKEVELENLSAHDGLTGLKNRLALRDDFPSLCGRDQYVIMSDLDDFKEINDTYGHEAGDYVLSQYAQALQMAFTGASIYRYGGDEFLLFVPVLTNEDDIEEIADDLCERFKYVTLESDGRIPAGTSLGVVHTRAKNMDELRASVRAADAALYEVKHAKKVGR